MSATRGAPPERRGRSTPSPSPRVERLTDDAAAVTFDVPADLAEEYAFAAGPVADPAPDDRRCRAPPHVLDLRARRPASPDRRTRDPGRAVLAWLVREVTAGQRDRGADRRPAASAPTPPPAGRHLLHRRRLRDHPDAVDRAHGAGEPRRPRDAALRQPHHRLGDVRRGARRPEEPLRPALPARARALPRAPRRRAVLRPPRRRPAAPAAGGARRRSPASTTCGCAARSR